MFSLLLGKKLNLDELQSTAAARDTAKEQQQQAQEQWQACKQ
jgi:hypothetical protein